MGNNSSTSSTPRLDITVHLDTPTSISSSLTHPRVSGNDDNDLKTALRASLRPTVAPAERHAPAAASTAAATNTRSANYKRLQNARTIVPENMSNTNARKLWIGGLPTNAEFDIYGSFIRQCFARAPGGNQIQRVELAHHQHTNQFLGFGYLTFSTINAAQRCRLAMHGSVIPCSQPVRVFKLQPYRPKPRLSRAASAPNVTAVNHTGAVSPRNTFILYISNIDYDITELELRRDLDARFPGITRVEIDRRLVTCAADRHSPGFGFVHFSDQAHLARAVGKLNNVRMKIGRSYIRAQVARENDVQLQQQTIGAGGRLPTTSASTSRAQKQRVLQSPSTASTSAAALSTSINADCCVCLSNTVDCVLYRCGHESICYGCAQRIMQGSGQCPICRKEIIDVIKTFRS